MLYFDLNTCLILLCFFKRILKSFSKTLSIFKLITNGISMYSASKIYSKMIKVFAFNGILITALYIKIDLALNHNFSLDNSFYKS